MKSFVFLLGVAACWDLVGASKGSYEKKAMRSVKKKGMKAMAMTKRAKKGSKCTAPPTQTPTCPARETFVRFATFNISLNRRNAGDLIAELAAPGSEQPAQIAEIIQRTRPDVILLNEFDYDEGNEALANFQSNYLSVSQNGADTIEYEYSFAAESNTGIPSGFDYDNNDDSTGPGDAYGFGFFPGQFGMAVLSKYPIDMESLRTFQTFRWKDMPCALLPINEDGSSYYDEGPELDSFRLSSKSHWDVPISIDGETVHFLVSHPTPPVFDGPEDRNGRRNHDEIRFWADYISGEGYIYDDEGYYGGLYEEAHFVIAGDLNSDPYDGDSVPETTQQLLDHPRINSNQTPYSMGGVEQSTEGVNPSHCYDPRYDTADFNDESPGNLRADYCLPSASLTIADTGVYWPLSSDPMSSLVTATDHRLVYVDAVF